MEINPQFIVDQAQWARNARLEDKELTLEFMLFVISALHKAKIITGREKRSWERKLKKE